MVPKRMTSYDGLLDITHGSTGVTVTNSYVRQQRLSISGLPLTSTYTYSSMTIGRLLWSGTLTAMALRIPLLLSLSQITTGESSSY